VDLLRLYLIAGIAAHKIYWEVTKRRVPPAPKTTPSLMVRAIKAVKVSILLAICVQVLLPWTVLPLSSDPAPFVFAGLMLYTAGLAMAIAGRAQLGNSWSDIETPGQVAKASLICHGLYRYIRHPIYTGILLAMIGSAIAVSVWWLIAVALIGGYFIDSAFVEERNMTRLFPSAYPEYQQSTNMLIPFIF